MAVSRRPPEVKTNKKYVYHIAFFIASILIIVAISPREGKFKYEFEKGKPWLQASLIAPWDFPILKPDQVISKERDSILKNFAPYFKMDSEVESTVIQEFEKYLNELLVVYEAEKMPLNPMVFITVKGN
jgi:hypothetical protein